MSSLPDLKGIRLIDKVDIESPFAFWSIFNRVYRCRSAEITDDDTNIPLSWVSNLSFDSSSIAS